MLVQRYDLRAKPGQEERLMDRLEMLGRWLIRHGGCVKVEILAQTIDTRELTLLEYWSDNESRHAAGIAMDRTLLQGIKGSAETIVQCTYRRAYAAKNGHAPDEGDES